MRHFFLVAILTIFVALGIAMIAALGRLVREHWDDIVRFFLDFIVGIFLLVAALIVVIILFAVVSD